MTVKNIEIKPIFTGENRNPIEFISQGSNGVQIAPDTQWRHQIFSRATRAARPLRLPKKFDKFDLEKKAR